MAAAFMRRRRLGYPSFRVFAFVGGGRQAPKSSLTLPCCISACVPSCMVAASNYLLGRSRHVSCAVTVTQQTSLGPLFVATTVAGGGDMFPLIAKI